jgi:isoamylase
LEFTKKVIHFRKVHPIFRRRRWFQGQPIKGTGLDDISWFLPEGVEMSEEHWNQEYAKALGVFMNGKGIRSVGPKGETIVDDSFYIIFNAHHESMDYILPSEKHGKQWSVVFDTSNTLSEDVYKPEDTVHVESRSVVLLQCPIYS